MPQQQQKRDNHTDPRLCHAVLSVDVSGSGRGLWSWPGLWPAEEGPEVDTARLQRARAERVREHVGRVRTERGQDLAGRCGLPEPGAQLQPRHCLQGQRGHGSGSRHVTGKSIVHALLWIEEETTLKLKCRPSSLSEESLFRI